MKRHNQRKPGEPVHQKPALRLVKSPEARPQPAPDPELKAMLDDMRRRYRVQRVRPDHGPDDRDAA
jgi:hypothetical protein